MEDYSTPALKLLKYFNEGHQHKDIVAIFKLSVGKNKQTIISGNIPSTSLILPNNFCIKDGGKNPHKKRIMYKYRLDGRTHFRKVCYYEFDYKMVT